MTKDPKKVEACKRLAEYNRRKREELKGVIGSLGYYLYQAKVNAVVTSPPQQLPKQPSPEKPPKASKFQME